MFLDMRTIRADLPRQGIQRPPRGFYLTLQKPSVSMPFETDPCFVGVFHTLNQRRAQLYH